mmetsp:Transcript_18956/g.52876  ORF Transcript_18956/g.52876 Transcript_18956/m.52876 type:complete len:228 (+) Transcript_18956:736-1419(+)
MATNVGSVGSARTVRSSAATATAGSLFPRWGSRSFEDGDDWRRGRVLPPLSESLRPPPDELGERDPTSGVTRLCLAESCRADHLALNWRAADPVSSCSSRMVLSPWFTLAGGSISGPSTSARAPSRATFSAARSRTWVHDKPAHSRTFHRFAMTASCSRTTAWKVECDSLVATRASSRRAAAASSLRRSRPSPGAAAATFAIMEARAISVSLTFADSLDRPASVALR